ncbi:MAG: hypothetical protein MJ211_11545 [Bacteroidales bacterium]|nr:hypothetical protein [Bacteroidales bacterium]
MPNIRFFNPGCEIEVANGSPFFNIPKYPALLENDLAVLPMFFSQSGDYVIVNQNVDNTFSDFWKQYFDVNFITLDNLISVSNICFDKFLPWGFSPRVLNIAYKFKNILSYNFLNSCVAEFNVNHKLLFNRKSSVDVFNDFLKKSNCDDIFPNINQAPFVATNISQAIDFFKFSTNNFGGAVFKALYGSSGRGVRLFRNNSLSDNILKWTNFVINTQGGVECEFLFNKVSDFSAHFDIINHKPIFKGFSRFSTTDSGFYSNSKVKCFNQIEFFDLVISNKFTDILSQCLENSIYSKYYEGPLGVDCLIYLENNKYKINPCVEINCRHSMGRLAIEIEHLVSENSIADFYVFKADEYCEMQNQKPIFKDNKLYSGFWEFTPCSSKTFKAGIFAKPIS